MWIGPGPSPRCLHGWVLTIYVAAKRLWGVREGLARGPARLAS